MAMFRSAFIGPDYRKLAKVRGFDDRTQSPIPVDPLRHQAFIAKAFIRDSAPFDACKTLGKGDLLGGRPAVERGEGFICACASIQVLKERRSCWISTAAGSDFAGPMTAHRRSDAGWRSGAKVVASMGHLPCGVQFAYRTLREQNQAVHP